MIVCLTYKEAIQYNVFLNEKIRNIFLKLINIAPRNLNYLHDLFFKVNEPNNCF